MSSISLDVALKIMGVVLTGVGVVVAVKKLRWDRRPDELEWVIDEHYPIDIDNDRVRFPGIFQQQNPTRGETGIMVRATFHGRHSITITGLSFEWNMTPSGRINVPPRTLQDGNSWEQLLFTREVAMDQITAVTIEAEGGRRFRREINLEYHRVFNAHVGTERP